MAQSTPPADLFGEHFRVWWNYKDGFDPDDADQTEVQRVERDRQIASIDASEVWLLSHRPTSEIEAICILEVMRYVMEGGGRSGGEDVAAAARLQAWLAERAGCGDGEPMPHRRLLHEFDAHA